MNNALFELFDEAIDETLSDLSKRPFKVVALALIMVCVENKLNSDQENYKNKDLKTLLEDACKEALGITDGIYLEIPLNDKETIH